MGNESVSLVSVAVITYNSSKTIIDTLESIYYQAYPNIELIISDDCSTDNTVEICRVWVEQHVERFVRTKILTVARNTGVSANCNRAEAACQGEWIKELAGDDLLMPNGIGIYVDYITSHPSAIFVFARCESFGINEINVKRADSQFHYDFFDLSLHEQYERLTLFGNCIPAATAFYNKSQIEKLGIRNDERIPLLEDWPKWINLIKAGVHFNFIDKVTVKYRVSETALSTNFNNFSPAYRKSLQLMYIYYQFPEEYKKSDDRRATIYKYLQMRNKIANNSLCWRIICKLYKVLVLLRW